MLTINFLQGIQYTIRDKTKKWKGAGKVIGQDSQLVLIKQGGTYVRVHPCRIMLERKIYVSVDHAVNSDGSEDEQKVFSENETWKQLSDDEIFIGGEKVEGQRTGEQHLEKEQKEDKKTLEETDIIE